MPYHHVAIQLCLSSAVIVVSQAYPFRDVSRAAGLIGPFGRALKYGGAGIADLDGDRYPDLLCVHHDQRSLQVYFNLGNGRFRQSRFIKWLDTHALNPIRLTPFDRRMYFVLSEGGSFGLKLKPPHVFRITKRRDVIVDVSAQSPDLQFSKGRGRSSIFLSLRTDRRMRVRPDMIATNADGNSIMVGRKTKKKKNEKKSPNHFAFQVYPNRTLHRRRLRHRPGHRKFAFMTTNYGGVTDIDNDGTMEVVLLAEVSVWKLVADFTLQDITMRVVPRLKKKKNRFANRSIKTALNSATAFAEIDYDNDGDWDLFFTQSAKRDMPWKSWILPRHDLLLRNNHINKNRKHKAKHTRGTMFTDVSVSAGIPRPGRSTESTGVTVGDFDNDGWVDIFIIRYQSPSSPGSRPAMILLRNQGNGRFRSVQHGLTRGKNVRGDMATAVDYDLDGRVDLIVSEGDWFDKSKGGFYRIMRNVMMTGNGFLLVSVKNGPNRRCTSLHAVVVVFMVNGRRMMRRVGSPGTAVAVSYIETVHFGLGKEGFVRSVRVKWVDGTVRENKLVRANSTVSFGVGW